MNIALASHPDFDHDFLKHRGPRLNFTAVPKSLDDVVTVPHRYSYDVLYALGDPIARGVPAYRNDRTDDAASFAHRAGDHHDAIQYFGLGPEEVLKEFLVHGVSIIEIAKNDFSSPDGLWFSRANPGLLWIETDDGAYTDVTNCMLLAAIPGKVGDGEARLITNVDGAASSSVTTYVGENPGESTAPDFATGAFSSHWPDGGSARPRSATIVITRNDGGSIGVE